MEIYIYIYYIQTYFIIEKLIKIYLDVIKVILFEVNKGNWIHY